jgi:Dyp-type peroxidase family
MMLDEPVLAIDDIQGDILAGFRKDHVRLVFFQFGAAAVKSVKEWLESYIPNLSTLRQVAGYNSVYKAMRLRMNREPVEMSVLWRNIAFTSTGLGKLIGQAEVNKFADESFVAGAESLSTTMGDPSDGSPGDARTWVTGSGANIPDAVVLIAADSRDALEREVDALTLRLAQFASAPPHIEIGEVRKSLPGHEHFGFKDGISQPGIRGKNPDGSYFTARYLDPTDPNASYFAAPGQPLVWPGEFLLNQPKQKGANTDPLQSKMTVDGPAWATNGSYLVFRRLRQNVNGFNAMAAAIHKALASDPAFARISLDLVGAMLVGRFRSGCPVIRSSTDNAKLAQNTYASNHFFFFSDTPTFSIPPNPIVAPDAFPPAKADLIGQRCPFGAHIRKVNPRDESTDVGDGSNNLQHRILRRGIPYGPEFDPESPDDKDRGLLFLCYQASIVNQFQFLMQDWVNGSDAPKPASGLDPLISPITGGLFHAIRPDGTTISVALPAPVVTATGAAFLFVPPISAIKNRLVAT